MLLHKPFQALRVSLFSTRGLCRTIPFPSRGTHFITASKALFCTEKTLGLPVSTTTSPVKNGSVKPGSSGASMDGFNRLYSTIPGLAASVPTLRSKQTISATARSLHEDPTPEMFQEKPKDDRPIPEVSYSYVRNLVAKESGNIIDVRERNEYQKDGVIPTSVNIPLGDVAEVFANSPHDLNANYGLDINSYGDEIVFHCRSGRRSQQAAEIARSLGYKNVKNYKGSMLEWAEKMKSDGEIKTKH